MAMIIMQVTPFIPYLQKGQPQFQNLNFLPNKHSSKFICCSLNSSDNVVSQKLAQHFNPNIPIEKAVTPPSSWYTHPSFFHLELDRVFYRGWQAVGQLKFQTFSFFSFGVFWFCFLVQDVEFLI
jgi:choline monooxygenase